MNEKPICDGAKLTALREAKSWSQSELGRRSGVDQSTISRLEAEKIDSPSLEDMAKLASALGVLPQDFMRYYNDVGKDPNKLRLDAAYGALNSKDQAAVLAMALFLLERK